MPSLFTSTRCREYPVVRLDFLIRHLPTRRVFPTIQTAGHLESFSGCRARDQIYVRLIIPKWFTAPIRGDEREQPVFNLVPFAGARRKMTDGNRKARFIRQLLQLQFPESQPRAIAAPAIRRDQQRARLRIQRSSFVTPPPPDGCDCGMLPCRDPFPRSRNPYCAPGRKCHTGRRGERRERESRAPLP